jgi:drug/metabolite transporter (DMT)-like permease
MSTFLALCLFSRLGYALNDVLIGRLARQHSQVEVAALRGLALGLTMAPLLCWVPGQAWVALGSRWPSYLLLIAVTAVANVLQNHATRFLPFGVRAALMLAVLSVTSVFLGVVLFAERLSLAQVALCVLLIGSAVLAALGTHASHEIRPDIPKGSALAAGAGVCLAIAAVLTKRLASETDPLLTAWAWECGAGAILLVPLLWEWRHGLAPGLARRFLLTVTASAPTVVGSGASVVALGLGALGLWGALAGTQAVFTAMLGVWWHREAMGVGRWLCVVAAAAAVWGLALLSH